MVFSKANRNNMQKKYEILYLVWRTYWNYLNHGEQRILRYGTLHYQQLKSFDNKYLCEKIRKREGKKLKDVEDEYVDWIEILKVIRHRPKYSEIINLSQIALRESDTK